MEKTDLIEFTPEGLEQVCQALEQIPEEMRRQLVLDTIKSVIRA